MPESRLTTLVANSPQRFAMPIATYPGLALTGASVRDVVISARAQLEAQEALAARYPLKCLLAAMDLSAEAEAFGCELHHADNEIPSVIGRRVTNREEVRNLPLPKPGDKRTGVYLEAVRLLRGIAGQRLVLGGCIGPFSLAARLVGVSEALELTLSDPELMTATLEKSTEFLCAYAQAFQAAGADGLIMAEPAAGLLSPRLVSRFSSASIRQVAQSISDKQFALVLHNCAARVIHLPAILETGLRCYHFGAPMDMASAFSQLPADAVVCGNLDPTGVFCQAGPDGVAQRTRALLDLAAERRNFVISSGCDLPPGTPLASLDAFFGAVTG